MELRFIKIKTLLANFLWKISNFLPDKYYLVKFRGGKIYLNLRESPMMIQRALGVYEPWKFKLFAELVKKDMTVIDIGANKGCFSLFSAKLMNDSGRVLSFEPEPENCNWITRSINENKYKSIMLLQMALSDSEGKADFFLGEKSGFHSLVPSNTQSESQRISVDKKRLDTVLDELGISKVDLVKIDVEGSEMQVLRGAVNMITSNTDLKILLDLHPTKGVNIKEVYDFLIEHGYRLYSIDKNIEPIINTDLEFQEIFATRKGITYEEH